MTSTKGATERDGMIIGGGDGGERIEERNRRRWRTERLMGNEGSRQRERERESPLRRQRRSRRSKRRGRRRTWRQREVVTMATRNRSRRHRRCERCH